MTRSLSVLGAAGDRKAGVLQDHDSTAQRFAARVRGISPDLWHVPPAPGRWSPAEEALHVALTYELGLAMLTGGAVMRPRVSPARALLLRWLVLPVMLRTHWFPRAKAPAEVRPGNEARDLSPAAVADRIERGAAALGIATRAADPGRRLIHAYFGSLTPLVALRLLCAHTRHHDRALARATDATPQS